MNLIIMSLSIIVLTLGCSQLPKQENRDGITIQKVEDIQWGMLNPARGDKSPKAGGLWGDRTQNKESGFLVKFNKGFSSPPHIHNITYRGIVIEGVMHNDDPNAAHFWLPKGSYWTQPAGEPHITAAKGQTNIIFLEIDQGPYLVKPVDQEFQNGEYPLNIHASNIIWKKDKNKQSHIETTDLWKNKENRVTGKMIRFKDQVRLPVKSHYLVILAGTLNFQDTDLHPGSMIKVTKESLLDLNCITDEECKMYIKTVKP